MLIGHIYLQSAVMVGHSR